MIDRRRFTPDGTDHDTIVPINEFCTVPTKRMVELLAGVAGSGKSVLEIGTGSGYQTAVLAERFTDVVSIEVQSLPRVQEKLPANVTLIVADGCTYDTGQRFDAVLVTFGATEIERAWVEQVREGGTLVVPLRVGGMYQIRVYVKRGEQPELLYVVAYANFTRCVVRQ